MIRIAVVGVGRMGTVHALNLMFKNVKGARLAAVCDLVDGKMERFKKKGVPTYADYRELVDSGVADAIVVATEHYHHREVAEYALSHGVHCLVEKPLCVTLAEARKLVATAQAHPQTLFAVMYNQRTNKIYRAAKELVQSGKIGDVQRASFTITNWYRSQAYYNQGGWRASWSGEGGGTLINQCIHQLDLLQWIVGMPKSVSATARTVNRNITTENEVTARFDYGDFDCVFCASAHELHGTNRLEIAGTRGRLVVEHGKLCYSLFAASEQEVNARTEKGYGNVKIANRGTVNYGALRWLRDTLCGQQRRVLAAFAAAISAGDAAKLVARGEEGLNALTLINAVYASNWSGQAVTLPMDEEKYEEELALHAAQENDNNPKGE